MIEISELSQKQMRKIQQQEPQKVLTVWIKPVSGQLNATQEEDEAQAKILTIEETQKRSLFTGKGKTLVLDKPKVAILHQDNTSRQKHVPEKDQRKVISNHHNGPLLEHPGRDKMIELIQQRYQFLNMRKAVEDYI